MAPDVAAASPQESRPTLLPEHCHDTDGDELSGHANDAPASPITAQRERIRAALPMAVVLCIVCAGLAGWLGFRGWQVDQLSAVHAQWVQVARQGALNLTTIDHSRVDADVQRISLIDDVVIPGAKQKQISAVATVPAAGAVSATEDHAVVLLFVDQTVNVGNDPPTDTASAVPVAWM
jgi:Mce-associated membrane protein